MRGPEMRHKPTGVETAGLEKREIKIIKRLVSNNKLALDIKNTRIE